MWVCSNCGERIDDDFDACWKCRTWKDGTRPDDSFKVVLEEVSDSDVGKYPVLKTIAWVYRILAWVVGGIFVIAFLTVLFIFNDSPITCWLTSLGLIVSGTISVVTIVAVSEIIYVFLDIEKNTRISKKIKGRDRKK